MSANAKMGFQVDDDGATRATASFDCLWLHQPPARSPRIRPLSSFSNITMPAADWTFIGPLDFPTPTEWSRGSSRMADMVRAVRFECSPRKNRQHAVDMILECSGNIPLFTGALKNRSAVKTCYFESGPKAAYYPVSCLHEEPSFV